jgi:hypothetical protein
MAVAAVPVVASSVASARTWWWTGQAYWSAANPFFGPHEPLAWIVGGLLVAALLGWALVRGADRRLVRLLFGIWGLAQVAFGSLAVLAWSVERSWSAEPVAFPVADVVGFAVAGLAAVVVAAGLLNVRGRREATATGVLAVAMTTLALAPSITRSVENAWPQDLPAFELRLVKALPIYDLEPTGLDGEFACPFVADVHGSRLCSTHEDANMLATCESVVEDNGTRFCLQHEDALVLTHADIRRVRWESDEDRDALTLILGRHATAAMRDRSLRREREARLQDIRYDALLIDGELSMVPQINDLLLDGAFTVHAGTLDDDGRTRDLYRALTGRDPPS